MALEKINIGQFTYHKEDNSFSTEASSLGLELIPKTFDIYNPKTNNSVTFNYANIEKRDGDILWWIFFGYCNNKKIELKIFND